MTDADDELSATLGSVAFGPADTVAVLVNSPPACAVTGTVMITVDPAAGATVNVLSVHVIVPEVPTPAWHTWPPERRNRPQTLMSTRRIPLRTFRGNLARKKADKHPSPSVTSTAETRISADLGG